ncbi:hypothetical protein HRbin02_01432 [Candidatus Calditenuaceae archaeon HR02]|nr:hypothetical protein HRbin02_01432 [Candidatus Calditenuaceae archaeon HR02]
MKYSVQTGPHGAYIQTYASFLENVVEGFRVGKPSLLLVKAVNEKGVEHRYYSHYGGGTGKLNIAVPTWLAGKGEKIQVFFKVVRDAEFIQSVPEIVVDGGENQPPLVIEKLTLDEDVLKLMVKQGPVSRLLEACNPVIGFDPRGVEITEGRYAGAPYVQFTLGDKTLRIYHNHGKTRVALGSGRNYYTVKSMEITDTHIKTVIQKKEEKVRNVSSQIPLD